MTEQQRRLHRLLRGEVTLLLDEGEVELKPFDVVIQRWHGLLRCNS